MIELIKTSSISKYKKPVIALFGMVTALTLLGTLFPVNYELPDTIWKQDKLWHFVAFLIWTILFGGVLTIRKKKQPRLLIILIYSASFGLLIEFLQFVLPIKRSPELLDFVADFLGSLVALGVLSFIFKKIFSNTSEKE